MQAVPEVRVILVGAFSLLCASGAPTTPAPKVHVVHAILFAPGPPRTVGDLTNADVRLATWINPTRVKIEHKGPMFDLSADLDLAQEHTYVEISVATERLLTGTEPWTVVIEPKARVPLVAGSDVLWELGFKPEDQLPVDHATLPKTSSATIPESTFPVEKCQVKAMHAAANKDSPRWEVATPFWKVHRAPKAEKGWRKSFADSNGYVVHGYVMDKDVKCPAPKPPPPSEADASQTPTPVSTEGTVQAREAKLPAGTRLYATAEALAIIVVLHKQTRAMQRDDGMWIVPMVKEGKGELELHGLSMPPQPNLALGPQQILGTGTTFMPREDWPRRRQQD